MISPEQQLTEKALHANFTEVQQVHFDRLMSELEQISGGLGFAELKEKAEAGDKEALQVMRDYITKKEEIVEFIETKNIYYWECDIEIGNRVLIWRPGKPLHGRVAYVREIQEDKFKVSFQEGDYGWHGFKGDDEEIKEEWLTGREAIKSEPFEQDGTIGVGRGGEFASWKRLDVEEICGLKDKANYEIDTEKLVNLGYDGLTGNYAKSTFYISSVTYDSTEQDDIYVLGHLKQYDKKGIVSSAKTNVQVDLLDLIQVVKKEIAND